jgi:hypothetical protein
MAEPALELTADEQAVLRDEAAAPAAEQPAADPTPTPEPVAESAPPVPAAEGVPSGTPVPGQPEAKSESSTSDRTIPLAVLLEEREKRQTLERNQAVLADRLDRLTRAQQDLAKPREPAAEPDPITRLQQTERYIADQQRAAEQHAQTQQIYSIAAQHENQFTATTPDYREAVTYLAEQRGRELELQGMTDPMERQQHLQRDWLALAYNAATTGRNTAEIAYQLAKARGWAPRPPAVANGATNGAAPAQIAEQRATTLQRGAAAAQSLSGMGGSPARAGTTLENLLQMSEKEFAEATADPDKFRKFFGE